MLSGLLHFAAVPSGRCGVEVPAETADYNQSIFCFWSPTMKQMDSNEGNQSFLEQRFGIFDGSAFSNQTALEENIQSLLERRDLDEAERAVYNLEEDIPVQTVENERQKLLRNVV